MTLQKIGIEGDATAADVLEGVIFTSKAEDGQATGTIPDNGAGTVEGPNDTMAGSGYYTSVSNDIPSHGQGTIDNPGDTLSGKGYYQSITNAITDRGDLDNLQATENYPSGYYSGGTVSPLVKNARWVNKFVDTTLGYDTDVERPIVANGLDQSFWNDSSIQAQRDKQYTDLSNTWHYFLDSSYTGGGNMVSTDSIDMEPFNTIEMDYNTQVHNVSYRNPREDSADIYLQVGDSQDMNNIVVSYDETHDTGNETVHEHEGGINVTATVDISSINTGKYVKIGGGFSVGYSSGGTTKIYGVVLTQ